MMMAASSQRLHIVPSFCLHSISPPTLPSWPLTSPLPPQNPRPTWRRPPTTATGTSTTCLKRLASSALSRAASRPLKNDANCTTREQALPRELSRPPSWPVRPSTRRMLRARSSKGKGRSNGGCGWSNGGSSWSNDCRWGSTCCWCWSTCGSDDCCCCTTVQVGTTAMVVAPTQRRDAETNKGAHRGKCRRALTTRKVHAASSITRGVVKRLQHL